MALSVLVGNGSQLIAMLGATLGISISMQYVSKDHYLSGNSSVFALMGFLSPSNRGALATVMIICWTLFGS